MYIYFHYQFLFRYFRLFKTRFFTFRNNICRISYDKEVKHNVHGSQKGEIWNTSRE